MKTKPSSRAILRESNEFTTYLDKVLQDLHDTGKKLEKAHELAPGGTAKAIVAGLHSDLFNKAAEFRQYVNQLKKISASASKEKSEATDKRALRSLIESLVRDELVRTRQR